MNLGNGYINISVRWFAVSKWPSEEQYLFPDAEIFSIVNSLGKRIYITPVAIGMTFESEAGITATAMGTSDATSVLDCGAVFTFFFFRIHISMTIAAMMVAMATPKTTHNMVLTLPLTLAAKELAAKKLQQTTSKRVCHT